MRFDLYDRSPDGFLLDVQTNLIVGFNTRLVVPLLPRLSTPTPIRRLQPIFDIEGRQFVMATHLMGAAATSQLGPAVDNLAHHYDEIVAALDMIFLGF